MEDEGNKRRKLTWIQVKTDKSVHIIAVSFFFLSLGCTNKTATLITYAFVCIRIISPFFFCKVKGFLNYFFCADFAFFIDVFDHHTHDIITYDCSMDSIYEMTSIDSVFKSPSKIWSSAIYNYSSSFFCWKIPKSLLTMN